MSEPLRPLRETLLPPEGFPAAPVDPNDRAASSRRIEGLLLATGALQRGHFLLKSGRHGDRYLEKWSLLQHPSAAAEIAPRENSTPAMNATRPGSTPTARRL